jgi:hypothetical protein
MTAFAIQDGSVREVEGEFRGHFFVGRKTKVNARCVSIDVKDVIELLFQRWDKLQQDINAGRRSAWK